LRRKIRQNQGVNNKNKILISEKIRVSVKIKFKIGMPDKYFTIIKIYR